MTDESLWPVRNVGEYAYCPRLFYYMQVEGVFLPSSDTEKGHVVHKKVDKPTADRRDSSEETSHPDRPNVARSLVLTSEALRLTATLDLAEIKGTVAVPVEYRKGRPRRVDQLPSLGDATAAIESPGPTLQAWPTDRVQVGLQAILLEEDGYTVPETVLYYAAEKLRLTIPFDSALKDEALGALEAAKECASGSRPLPLVNSPKCPRCSLQPICLPDEINYQRAESPSTEASPGQLKPRTIWPPRDDGIHVLAQKNGVRIGVRGMGLKMKDRDGKTVKEMPLANIEGLSVLGSVQVSTQALRALADRKIPVAFLSAAGRLVAMVDPLDSVSADIRRAQVRRMDKQKYRLELSRALVSSKISNQRTLLMRNHPSLPKLASKQMAKEMEGARNAGSIETLRGHEGQGAALYFDHFSQMFKGPIASEFKSNGRRRRPPPDPINSCLSFAYTMLANECVSALRLARLEPTIGGYHTSRPGRPAFALDLMEPFRPLIADSLAVSSFNRGELTEGHFLRTSAGCAFTDSGRGAFFNAYGRRMEAEITHPVFGYRLSYRRMLILHARMIAAWLLGEVSTLSFLTTR